jgi:hypothetical protein
MSRPRGPSVTVPATRRGASWRTTHLLAASRPQIPGGPPLKAHPRRRLDRDPRLIALDLSGRHDDPPSMTIRSPTPWLKTSLVSIPSSARWRAPGLLGAHARGRIVPAADRPARHPHRRPCSSACEDHGPVMLEISKGSSATSDPAYRGERGRSRGGPGRGDIGGPPPGGTRRQSSTPTHMVCISARASWGRPPDFGITDALPAGSR